MNMGKCSDRDGKMCKNVEKCGKNVEKCGKCAGDPFSIYYYSSSGDKMKVFRKSIIPTNGSRESG